MKATFWIATALAAMLSLPAAAQSIDMGNCTQDKAVPAERIVVACTNFINDRMIENWRMEYIANALYYRALANERLEKDTEALKDFRELMQKDPQFSDAWVHYAEIVEKKGGPEQFMKVMDIMIATSPADPQILNTACWERAKKGEQLDAALADCNESLRLKPGVANVLDSRGFVNFRMSKFAASNSDCTAALAIDPKLASSLYIRGLARKASGDVPGGNADVDAGLRLDPGIADRYASYGVKP